MRILLLITTVTILTGCSAIRTDYECLTPHNRLAINKLNLKGNIKFYTEVSDFGLTITPKGYEPTAKQKLTNYELSFVQHSEIKSTLARETIKFMKQRNIKALEVLDKALADFSVEVREQPQREPKFLQYTYLSLGLIPTIESFDGIYQVSITAKQCETCHYLIDLYTFNHLICLPIFVLHSGNADFLGEYDDILENYFSPKDKEL